MDRMIGFVKHNPHTAALIIWVETLALLLCLVYHIR